MCIRKLSVVSNQLLILYRDQCLACLVYSAQCSRARAGLVGLVGDYGECEESVGEPGSAAANPPGGLRHKRPVSGTRPSTF